MAVDAGVAALLAVVEAFLVDAVEDSALAFVATFEGAEAFVDADLVDFFAVVTEPFSDVAAASTFLAAGALEVVVVEVFVLIFFLGTAATSAPVVVLTGRLLDCVEANRRPWPRGRPALQAKADPVVSQPD